MSGPRTRAARARARRHYNEQRARDYYREPRNSPWSVVGWAVLFILCALGLSTLLGFCGLAAAAVAL